MNMHPHTLQIYTMRHKYFQFSSRPMLQKCVATCWHIRVLMVMIYIIIIIIYHIMIVITLRDEHKSGISGPSILILWNLCSTVLIWYQLFSSSNQTVHTTPIVKIFVAIMLLNSWTVIADQHSKSLKKSTIKLKHSDIIVIDPIRSGSV